MPHVLVKQSCSEQANAISQEGYTKETPRTELEESDTEDQGIDEECTGEAEWKRVFENIFHIFKSHF